MRVEEWSDRIGEAVRESMQSDTYRRYYATKLTAARAAIDITQTGLFIKHRRDCWPQVAANCPESSVKQKILEEQRAEDGEPAPARQEEDDSIRVDEDGVEWWQDDEGQWWYRPADEDDWFEWE